MSSSTQPTTLDATASVSAAQQQLQKPQQPQTPNIKGKLSDYTIEKRIGKGQFSTVYRGIRIKDALVVAIKKIPVRDAPVVLS